MLELPSLGLYVHIPWCIKKCPYCDFNSHCQNGIIPEKAYVDQLLADLTSDLTYIGNRAIDTIFIGGGTPSLFSTQAIELLLSGIYARVPVAPQAEITLEVNPGSAERARLKGYRAAGVNRFSIGVQSFNHDSLQRLGRVHSATAATSAVQLATTLPLTRVNLDLMHGLPQQSLAQAMADLQQAIALAPNHISWYQLTIEPYTEFGAKPPSLPADQILWQMWQHGNHLLQAADYLQYEISAYARSNDHCLHNLNYWRFGDYLGIGCGAHGKISFQDGQIIRTVKTRHPRGYLQGKHRQQQRNVPLDQRPLEFFMNRWRLIEPTPRDDFSRLTGLPEATIRSSINTLLPLGYLQETARHWQLTEHGRLFLNSVLECFLV